MPAAVAADSPPSTIAAVAAEDGEEHPSSPPLPLSVSGVSPVSDSDKFIVLGGRKIVKKKKRKCVKCELGLFDLLGIHKVSSHQRVGNGKALVSCCL